MSSTKLLTALPFSSSPQTASVANPNPFPGGSIPVSAQVVANYFAGVSPSSILKGGSDPSMVPHDIYTVAHDHTVNLYRFPVLSFVAGVLQITTNPDPKNLPNTYVYYYSNDHDYAITPTGDLRLCKFSDQTINIKNLGTRYIRVHIFHYDPVGGSSFISSYQVMPQHNIELK